MCGIAGFINFSEDSLKQINSCKVQHHRGPDAQQEMRFDNVVLSHQRLSIIDISKRSDQPFIKDGLAIVFNGEIYNYKQIKQEILSVSPNIVFKTTSDTEVLLELYRLKKQKCLDDARGMFAFAIYEIENKRLFIARDHFGIKPLFYTINKKNELAFSSELKTLVKTPGFDKTINQTSLVASINYLWIPSDETIFENCYKLSAAHYAFINVDEPLTVVQHCYWQLNAENTSSNEVAITEKLQELIESSVKYHMIADVPVSSFLSGGLDSSVITVLAKRINTKLSSYTIGITKDDKKVENMHEDLFYAKKLAKDNNLNHHQIIVDSEIINMLPKIVYDLDEPIGDPAAINTYLMCEAARKDGVKVLLSGMGADEIFFGYRRHKATLLAVRYRRLPSFLRKGISAVTSLLPVRMGSRGLKLFRWAKKFMAFAELPIEEAYMRSYSYYDKKELEQLFVSDITEPYQKIRRAHADLFNTAYDSDIINKICYTDIFMFMKGLNLTYTDRASMAASVEVRVPFIDKEIISFAMQIPGKLKYKKKQLKYILKKAAEKYLPAEIIYRPKASFGAPIRSWISGDLKPMIDDLLSKKNVQSRGIFNYNFIQNIIDEDRKGTQDNAYRIYQLLTLELWFRQFVDSESAPTASTLTKALSAEIISF